MIMENLETIQIVWETTTKAFDKMNEEEKKEWFNNLIENLDNNDKITRLKNEWDSVSEEEKAKLYKRWAITLSQTLKRSSPILTYYTTMFNGAKNTIKQWPKHAVKIALLEQIPCRFLVELWILTKPKSLTKEKLIADTKKDAKNYNTYLWICNTICKLIPEARPITPFIDMARHYTKRYEKKWTDVLITRLDKQQEKNIKQQTQKELSDTIRDIQVA